MFVVVLSDKPELRESFCASCGKESNKDDLNFYSIEGKSITLINPVHYPEKIQPLLYSLSMADYVVLIVDGITPKVGELIVAINAIRIEKGTIVSKTPLPLAGTVLDKYDKVSDQNAAKEKVMAASVAYTGENALALVNKTEAVKSIGNVAFGVLKAGKLKIGDKLFALPSKLELEIRSLHVNGVEVDEVTAGVNFEMAYKGDLFDRAAVVPLRNDFEVETVVNGRFNKSPFYKDEIKGRICAYSNMQFVEGTVTDNDVTLSSPFAFEKGETLLIVDASNQKLRVAGVFQSKW